MTARLRRVVFAVQLLSAVASQAAPRVGAAATFPAEWKRFGLQGTTVRSLAATEDLLCAGTQGAGVFCRPLDGSTGWQSNGLAGLTVTWLWIDPRDPLVRFAASSAPANTPSLHRTLDGGVHWVAVDQFPAPGGRAWAVHGVPASPTVFAAGVQLWVSHDRGTSWSVSSSAGALDCLEVSPTDSNAIWSGGETVIFSGFTIRSLDGGASWDEVWDSHDIGDNQTADVAAHPVQPGLVLTGHEGFVLRTENNGATFAEVLAAGSRFVLDWDGGNPQRAYAAGSPNGGTAHAFVSADLGRTWSDVTGTFLAPRTVFRLEGDEKRTGVVYAATDDGVYRYYGGGALCLDASAGIDALLLQRGACPPERGTGDAAGPSTIGDVIAADPANFIEGDATLFLGEVECLANDSDLDRITLDVPDPAPGRVIVILARLPDGPYGFTSYGLVRAAFYGDCP